MKVDRAVYEVAIDFARMWGVMETMEQIPNWGFEKVRKLVIELAEEYIAAGRQDLVKFFEERTKEIRQDQS